MEVNNQDFEVVEDTCPYCSGDGCDLCGMSGTIKRRVRPQPYDDREHRPEMYSVQEPKIVVTTNEFEKDSLITQMGRLNLPSSTAMKEYSAALTFYNEVLTEASDMKQKEFNDTFLELITALQQYRIDTIEPVGLSLDLIHGLKSKLDKINDRTKIMSVHFELALEALNRAYKDLKEDYNGVVEELRTKAKAVPKQQQPVVPYVPEPPMEKEEDIVAEFERASEIMKGKKKKAPVIKTEEVSVEEE